MSYAMWLKRWIHTCIIALKCEFVFIKLQKQIPFFGSFIPMHSLYGQKAVRKITRGGVQFCVDISDYVQWLIFIDAKDLLPALAITHVKANSIVFDIGANVGQFSFKLAKQVSSRSIENVEIHAMEPNPHVFKLLDANLSLNQELKGKVFLHQLAVGATEREAEFIFGDRNSGAGRFMLEREKAHTIVQVVTLDDFYRVHAFIKKISFIKIDVEGFEPEVIAGAEMIIDSHKPVLFFEFSPAWYQLRGVHPIAFLQKLSRFGYRFFFEKEGSMVPLNANFEELQGVHQTNILALQEE